MFRNNVKLGKIEDIKKIFEIAESYPWITVVGVINISPKIYIPEYERESFLISELVKEINNHGLWFKKLEEASIYFERYIERPIKLLSREEKIYYSLKREDLAKKIKNLKENPLFFTEEFNFHNNEKEVFAKFISQTILDKILLETDPKKLKRYCEEEIENIKECGIKLIDESNNSASLFKFVEVINYSSYLRNFFLLYLINKTKEIFTFQEIRNEGHFKVEEDLIDYTLISNYTLIWNIFMEYYNPIYLIPKLFEEEGILYKCKFFNTSERKKHIGFFLRDIEILSLTPVLIFYSENRGNKKIRNILFAEGEKFQNVYREVI